MASWLSLGRAAGVKDLPCSPERWPPRAGRLLAALSARRLAASPRGRAARCTRAGGAALALRPRRGWLVGCVPVRCLGHEPELRRALRALHGGFKELPHAALRLVQVFPSSPLSEISLVELDEEVFQDLESPWDVVAVTDVPEEADALAKSLIWPRLKILQPPTHRGPWKFRFFDSERYLLSYVTRLTEMGLGERLVIYADAFDSTFLSCSRDLEEALRQLNRPIFFGAEFDLYPAGLFGYPLPSSSHTSARLRMQAELGMEDCRPKSGIPQIWESEKGPCIAWSENEGVMSSGNEPKPSAAAEYLNGGFYGGRAWALQRALRRLLDVQGRLRERNADGLKFQHHGRTHQYLWNQYMLEHPNEVTLDYGGSVVVNLAQRSLLPRQFFVEGEVKSVLFQKAVCFIHANAGGLADSTFHLLRTAHYLNADTSSWSGFRFHEELDSAAQRGLRADKSLDDRVVLDFSLCFNAFKWAKWKGVLSNIYLQTPFNAVTFNGLQFFIARPRRPGVVRVQALQPGSIQTRKETGRAKPPNGTHHFSGRNRFDTQIFEMSLQPDDCLAWRCRQRCDLTYEELQLEELEAPAGDWDAGVAQRRGTWMAAGRHLTPGQEITLTQWQPRRYAMGAQADVHGFLFY